MRKKFTTQILLSVMLFITVSHLAYEFYDLKMTIADYSQTPLRQMNSIFEILKTRPNRSAPVLAEQLDLARRSAMFDFYQINSGVQVLEKSPNIEDLDVSAIPTGEIYSTGAHFIKKEMVGPYAIVIGKNWDERKFFTMTLSQKWPSMLVDLLILCAVIAVLLTYKLQVLTSISRTLSQLTPKDLETVNHTSQEIRTIVNFLKAFIDQNFKSEQQNDLFKKNLADGILNELFTAKKKPPYPIQVVLVRFDMNNYTRRALQENTEALTALLSEYFQKIKELRIRYGGLDYQFIGDEKVLFFKVENPDDLERQLLRATAFLRDAFLTAQSLSHDIPLTFKGAIVPGTLIFYELDGSHYFTGAPLIESARYLTTVSEKNKSIMTFPTVHNEKIKKLARPEHTESVLLKGFEHPLNISFFDSFDIDFSTEKDPTLFLSDQGFIKIIQELHTSLEKDRTDLFFQIFQMLRSIRAEQVCGDVVVQFEKLLEYAIEKYKNIERENKILSSVISLCWIFIPAGNANGKIKELLYSLIRHKDIRVASNALMASQRYEWNETIIDQMLNSPSNRLRGDALVLLGRRGIDQVFFRSWKALIENKDSRFVLSGLWASQEVFKFHSENNPTHLKSNPLVESMVEIIVKMKKNQQPQISQRAQWALDSFDSKFV